MGAARPTWGWGAKRIVRNPAGKTIILSYRRDDSADISGRIFDRLVQHFGADRVFIDIDSIPAGVDFHDHIHSALDNCGALLAVIGKGWSGPRRGRGSRIMDAEDWVRLEVETALTSKIPVIPVLVGHAELPTSGQLPETLAALQRRNAVSVDSGRDFHPHMNRLIGDIERLLGNEAPPQPTAEPVAIAQPAALADLGPSEEPPQRPVKTPWRIPAPLLRAALAATAVLVLASLALLGVPALELLLRAEPGERGVLDAVIRMASVPTAGKAAIALVHAAAVLPLFLLGEKINRRLWLAILGGSLLALLAAVYLYLNTGAAFLADEFASYPSVSGVLIAVLQGGDDYDGAKQALYASLRAWIYLGVLWNLLVVAAMIRNKLAPQ